MKQNWQPATRRVDWRGTGSLQVGADGFPRQLQNNMNAICAAKKSQGIDKIQQIMQLLQRLTELQQSGG